LTPRAASVAEVLGSLSAQIAAFLALLLAASAAHKVLGFTRARSAAHEFAGVPRTAAAAAAAAVIFAETLGATLVIVPSWREAGAWLAAALFGAYLGLIARAIVERREVDCGCSFSNAPHPLGAFEATRNGVLVVLAMLAALSSAADGAWPVSASQAVAACALFALYAALDQVMGQGPVRKNTSP
jgi:hypothetical protein